MSQFSFKSTEISGYELIATLNKWFQENQIDKQLPSPMGYTYIKKGMVDGIKGTHKVTQESATTWYLKYLEKNGYVTAEPIDEVTEATEAFLES